MFSSRMPCADVSPLMFRCQQVLGAAVGHHVGIIMLSVSGLGVLEL